MISIQNSHLFNEQNYLSHARVSRRNSYNSRVSKSKRKNWGFAAAGMGAAVGGALLARNKRVRKLVQKAWEAGKAYKSKFKSKLSNKFSDIYTKTRNKIKYYKNRPKYNIVLRKKTK